MAQFSCTFTKDILNGSLLTPSLLKLTDTSNYEDNTNTITKEDFYSRKFTISDINNNVMQVLDLGATGTMAEFSIGGLLTLQPLFIQVRLDLIGFGGVYSTQVPYYLPALLP